MKRDREDLNGDPQQTLPPRQGGASRRIVVPEPEKDLTAGTKGRRLKLGTPIRGTPPPQDDLGLEISPSVQRGFNLGEDAPGDILPANAARTGVQPWILFVAGGAMVLLMLALLLAPSSDSSPEGIANERLLAQYTKYLQANGHNVDVNERKKEVVSRLQAVAWARAIGDKAALQSELSGLLFLDSDKNSPLYQYSVSQLKELGPLKKADGL